MHYLAENNQQMEDLMARALCGRYQVSEVQPQINHLPLRSRKKYVPIYQIGTAGTSPVL